MLDILPFLTWFAAITSLVLLVALSHLSELSRRAFVILLGWFLVAGYCQFFAGSMVVGALGLALQTLLAVYLVVRWRWSA